MPTELSATAVHQGDMRVSATAREHTVQLDYPLRPDDAGAGMRPLEALLASLASCCVGAVSLLLRRAEQPFQGLEVTARGLRRDQHPTVFTEIALEVVVRGAGVDAEVVARVLDKAEKQICPVWAMLAAGTPIRASSRVVA